MTRKGWLLFTAMSVVWGIPYLFIKIAVRELDPSSLSERTKQRSGQPLRQRVRPSLHGLKRLNGARSPTENGR